MFRYALSRIAQALIVLAAVSFGLFMLMRAVPGDPALFYAGVDATPDVIDAVRRSFGLDKSLIVQYGIWLGHALRGDFGQSYFSGRPAFALVVGRMPATAELAAASAFFALIIGVPTGIAMVVCRGSRFDGPLKSAVAIAQAMPNFWLGLVLIILFAVDLHWFPASGREGFASIILPTIALGSTQAAVIARFTRASVAEANGALYATAARARGMPASRVVLVHVFKNALLPILTIYGIIVGQLLGGAVVVEAVFRWPGIGTLTLNAINNRDYALVQTAVLMIVALFIASTIVVDLLYGVVDPRAKLTVDR
jgi:peptide/nickel transport system permease protein